MSERIIKVHALTRVEGEGGLYLKLDGQRVETVRLEIFEPPRLFEGLLVGRSLEEVPDITARICGICPVAYQMSSVHALESLLGIDISPEIRRLRRLLYCGEWIESHALHVYMLNAPDFLGLESGLDLANDFPEVIERGLRMKKYGNALLEVLGGRAIHPVNVRVGGFHAWPRRAALQGLLPDLKWGLEAAVATVRWVAGFAFPDFDRTYQLVSLKHPDEYPMNEGVVACSSGERIDVTAYESEFEELHLPHSTALHSRRAGSGDTYLTGPLARVGLNFDQLSPTAQRLSQELGLTWPCWNPFRSILARALELIHAFEEAVEIVTDLRWGGPAHLPYSYRAGQGCAATEAPRGLIYHRFTTDAAGKITSAKIVPPTSQNQSQIESDLREWVPQIPLDDDAQATRSLENLVRCYDPCISCSTHFLKVRIDRQ